nr:helix-hairpin-helix domain-containing protein [Neobacillus sp. Marseille-Q6967]
MKDWLNEHKFYVVIALVIAFGGIYYFFTTNNEASTSLTLNDMNENLTEPEKGQPETTEGQSIQQPEHVMVDVKGQVKKPGVYESRGGERVIDLINRAGGLTENADENQVNLAEHVVDAMVIYIPAKGEEGTAAGASTANVPGSGGTSGQSSKINLNKADETELQTLPGIGPAKAAAIIEYRETNGSYKTIEDLKNISGIGDKTFEKLKDLIQAP